jgi:4'-phosphopantetheinyl transferase EntD
MAPSWPVVLSPAPGIVLVCSRIDLCQGELLSEEVMLLDGAGPSRVREIRAGRTAARIAFHHVGTGASALLSDPDGLPVWPSGFVGSLSHTRDHIAVALARSDRWTSIGIDVDDARSLDEVIDEVATPREIRSLEPVLNPGITAVRLAFCAKEAIFKCQYPVTGNADLEFLDVQVFPGGSPGTLRVTAADGGDPSLAQLLSAASLQWVTANEVTLLLAGLGRPMESV